MLLFPFKVSSERVKFLAHFLGFLFFGLCLANGTDCVFYHPVCIAKHFLRLTLRLGDDLLFLSFNITKLRLVGDNQFLEPFLVAAYRLSFLLPVAFVTGDLAEIPVEVDVPLSCPG